MSSDRHAARRPASVRCAGATASVASMRLSARAPRLQRLQRVDPEQQHEREHQHHRRERGRARVVVLLQLGHDQQRRDLGPHRQVAGDEDHRAVLAERAREREREAREHRRQDRRAGSRGGTSARASRPGSPPPPPLRARGPAAPAARVRTTNGRPMNVSATTMPSGVKATGMPSGSRMPPDPAVRRVHGVSAMPATAVGSANGRSTSASMTGARER